MKLSVIVPFYEKLGFLQELIKVLHVHILPYKDQIQMEVIIVNDSPWIPALDIEIALENFSVLKQDLNLKIIQQEKNTGVAKARTRGIELARGEHLYLLDQDDLVSHCFMEVVLDYLSSDLDFLLMNATMMHEKENASYPYFFWNPNISLKGLILDDFVRSPGQVLFRKSLLGQFEYPEPVAECGCDDRFLWINMFLYNPHMRVGYDARNAYIARIHDVNFGADSRVLYRCSLALWNKFDQNRFGQQKQFVRENILALRWILGEEKTFESFLAYFRYRFRFMKMIRFIVKRFLFIKGKF